MQDATYQLLICVDEPVTIGVGRLGAFEFPAGYYVYTGSARRGMAARLKRHLSRDKRLRWHIDYLLASPYATVVDVRVCGDPECLVNRRTPGVVVVPGFGASDCRAGCDAHLKMTGNLDREAGGMESPLAGTAGKQPGRGRAVRSG